MKTHSCPAHKTALSNCRFVGIKSTFSFMNPVSHLLFSTTGILACFKIFDEKPVSDVRPKNDILNCQWYFGKVSVVYPILRCMDLYLSIFHFLLVHTMASKLVRSALWIRFLQTKAELQYRCACLYHRSLHGKLNLLHWYQRYLCHSL